jgi:hypothetical protein
MGHGAWSPYLVSMASGDSLTSALDLGRAFPSVYVEIASTPSNCDHRILAAASLTATYNTVYHPAINSSTVAVNPYVIASGVTGAIVPIPGGFRFIKIFATAAMTNGATYKVYCGDE